MDNASIFTDAAVDRGMTARSWKRIATGVLVVLIGLMLLLVTTDRVEADILWAWIPALFVLLGVWALVRSGFRNLVAPVMLIAIAGAFLLRAVGVFEPGVISTYWPLFIVLFGVLLIINRSRRRRLIAISGGDPGGSTAIGIFSNDRRRIVSDSFVSAEAIAIFGDSELDLRESTIPVSPAVVEATAIFDDVEVRVPEDWTVELEVLSVFGDVIDRRPRPAEGERDGPLLRVTGTAIFGDIEVRD